MSSYDDDDNPYDDMWDEMDDYDPGADDPDDSDPDYDPSEHSCHGSGMSGSHSDASSEDVDD